MTMAEPTTRERADAALMTAWRRAGLEMAAPSPLARVAGSLDVLGTGITGALGSVGEAIGGAVADSAIEQDRAMGITRTSFGVPKAQGPSTAPSADQPGAHGPQDRTMADAMALLEQSAGGPVYAPVTDRSSTTTRQSSALDPAEALRLGQQLAAADESRKQIERDVASGRDALDAQAQAVRSRVAQAADAERARAGGRATAAESRLRALDAQLDAQRAQLDGTEMQTLATFSTAGKVMLGLAAALEGFSASQQRRPSNVGQLLQLALNQDMQIQRGNLQRNLERLGATERQRDDAMARWKEAEGTRRASAERGMAMQLADLAARGKTLDDRMDYARAASEMTARSVQQRAALSEAGRAKTTSSSSSQTQMAQVGGAGAAGGKGAEISADVIKITQGVASVPVSINSYLGQLSKFKEGTWAGGAASGIVSPAGERKKVDATAREVAMSAVRLPGTGPVDKLEGEANLSRVPQVTDSIPRRRMLASAMYDKFASQLKERIKTAVIERKPQDVRALLGSLETLQKARAEGIARLSRQAE